LFFRKVSKPIVYFRFHVGRVDINRPLGGANMFSRRQLLSGIGIMVGAAAQPGSTFAASEESAPQAAQQSLALSEFSPKSMLHVHETQVARARFPVIDFHTHITRSAKSLHGVSLATDRVYLGG